MIHVNGYGLRYGERNRLPAHFRKTRPDFKYEQFIRPRSSERQDIRWGIQLRNAILLRYCLNDSYEPMDDAKRYMESFHVEVLRERSRYVSERMNRVFNKCVKRERGNWNGFDRLVRGLKVLVNDSVLHGARSPAFMSGTESHLRPFLEIQTLTFRIIWNDTPSPRN